ncbi:MAG: type II toxin-antitoxin system HicA family toxin [Defluviitaleaceae bacterium]|nr:type II toxin-antitoxin system HicA family toxin [Defluviitaleaceae bacterium]
MNKKKLLLVVMNGSKNVSFNDFVRLIESFGFKLHRTNGSHRIYKHPYVVELLSIQNVKGEAKPYQVNEFLGYVDQYNLQMED